MKKTRHRRMLIVLLFFVSVQTGLFAQRQAGPYSPVKMLVGLKNLPSYRRVFPNARTASCSYDSLVFTRQSQIDSFPITNPGCTVLRELRIYGEGASPAITRLDSLRSVTEITGFFELDHTSLTDLNGLSGLQRTAWLWLGNNPLMTNVMPPNLSYVGSVLLNELPLFRSFSGFTQNLASSRLGYLWLFNNLGLANLNGLESLDSVDNLASYGLPDLQSFQGLQNLHYCSDLAFFGNGNLTDVSALSGITDLVYGSLKIDYNYSLNSLNGLQNIRHVGGILEVQGSPFTSLSGLNPAMAIDHGNPDDTLRIQDNYQLSACGFAPLCDYLAAGKPAYIDNNAPGCSSIADVQASCNLCATVGVKSWSGSVSDDWDDAANWTPMGVPASCDSVVITTNGGNRPALGSNAVIHALKMEAGTELYMNGYGITVNGDANLQGVYMGSSGCGCESLNVNNARVINIANCTMYMQNINLTGYRDSLTLANNNLDNDVVISDGGNCLLNYISGNTFGSLAYTANSTNPDAYAVISPDNDDYVNGAATFNLLRNESQNTFDVGGNGNTFHIGGDLRVNNNLSGYLSLGNIDFNGSNDAHITQSGSEPIEIRNLFTNKYPGSVILDQNVLITNDVKFTFGVVKTAPAKVLIFDTQAGISQTSSGSYVSGPVQKRGLNGQQTFFFPVGDNACQGHCGVYNPANGAVPDVFSAQYYRANPSSAGYDTSRHDASVSILSGKEYWSLTKVSGTADAKVVLRYDSAVSQVTNSINNLRVMRWNGSRWKNNGAFTINGVNNFATVTADSLSSALGIYSLGYTYNYHPVITVGPLDSVLCRGSYFRIRFAVDTPMLNGNYFFAQISDSSGVFGANPTVIGGTNPGATRADSILAFIPYYLPAGGQYKIRVLANNPADTSINTRTVGVKTVPQLPFTVVGRDTACSFSAVKYYVSQREAGAAYTWSVYGGSMVTDGDTATVTWGSAFYISYGILQATVSNGCGNGNSAYLTPRLAFAPPAAAPVISNTGRWLAVPPPPANQDINVQWYRNGTLITGATNTNYYASLAGSYTANYITGCAAGPLSNAIAFAANSLPQSISFQTVATKIYTDSSFVLSASASSGLPVEFSIISGPGNILGNVFIITGAGTVTIRALQPGSSVYDTAASVTQTFTINKATQAISFTSVSDKDYTAGTVALAAAATSGLPVSYSVLSGPATVSGNGLTLTGAGTVTVRALQLGDNNYLAALPVDRSFCVRVSSLNGINGPVSICPGIAATYTTTAVPNATYTWRLQGGSSFSSTTNTLIATWPAPGTYTLIVNATGGCGAPGKNDTLVVTAITSVQPDSVHNMLPVNGAVNQQLPLNLSWIPANPDLYYTYDVYVWKAGDPQPSTPMVAAITTVNYTLPLNSGLAYNTTYKWMVVAHNGSCTVVHTGPVQQFSLIPLPDLQVYNVTAPATAFSGQPVSVTWKVKNNGPGNTQLNQSWTDAVFISKDSVLDFTNPAGLLQFPVIPLLVATKPAVSALNGGETYNDTATFTLPVDYSGPLYLHVVTNYAPPSVNPVIETTYANDTAHALPLTQVTLSPQPDFRVDTVVNPNNTFSGSAINVTYKVKNYGVTGTGAWVDKIYLSKDALFNPATALRLTYPNGYGGYFPQAPMDIYRNGALQGDSSYTVSVQAVVPNFIFGQYYVYVVTNATASIYEGPNGQNNIQKGNLMQIFLTQTPKLVPSNVSIPSVIGTAQTVAVSWNTQNQGAFDNIEKNLYPFGTQDTLHPWGRSQWYDRAFLSTDSVNVNVNTDLRIADIYQNNDVYPGKYFYAQQAWQVPDNLAPGDYWLYVFANATRSVFEYPGTPQIVRSQKVTVVRPDLTVPSVTVPSSGSSGQTILVNYTVQNNSGGAVNDRYRRDYFYLGDNGTFDGTAVLIDSAIYTSYTLPANGSVALQKGLMLPNGVSGAKYIFVRANGAASFGETTFGNNTSTAGAPINISLTPGPDLVVSAINVANNVSTNTGTPFAYTVTNNGPGIAQGTWKDSLFVSCSATFNYATGYYVGQRTQQLYVPPSGSYTDSFNLVFPQTFLISSNGCMNSDAPQLYFFVKANAGSGIYEANLSNNLLVSAQRTVTNVIVDHIVSSVRNDDTAAVGRSAKVAWTVKNLGLNPADNTYSGWYDGVYLSADTVLSGEDRLLGYKFENTRLARNGTYSDSFYVNIPDVPDGNYYVLLNDNAFNNIPAERNLANNNNLRRNGSNAPLKTYVRNLPPPDITAVINSAPSATAAGQPVKIVYTVTNNGTSATNPGYFYNNIWLSTSFAAGGYYLGQGFMNRSLQPGESATDSITATLPLSFVQGNYVIVLHANTGTVYEANYANNYAYRYISVYTPAPVDLMVNNVSAADTVTLGYPTAVNWRIFNNSGNPASGIETDGIYLSTDSTANNTADVLAGTKTNALSILPLNTVDETLQPVISGVPEGVYYLKVRTDILRNILETNTGNNTALLNKKVYVQVRVLPVNVTTPDVLTTAYLYYKLIIPAALRGRTVQVKLTSNDSLTATNQLYAGLGYLPSAARFDYSHSSAGGGNQQIIIESVADSVYYIAVRSTKAGTQQVRLLATELPFALLTINATKGGNTGNVTVQLKGTLFSGNMTAKIKGLLQNNTINATSIYFVNGTTAYATFNLRNAPLGVYDVSLIKPDNTVALLSSGFTVEKGGNGGLLTGGDNTGQTGSGAAPGCDPGAAGGLNTQLQTDLVIPPKVFSKWPFVITINYTNGSNVDVPAQVRVLYSLDGAPLGLTEADLAAGKTSMAIEFKDSFGAPNVIRAGSTGTIKVYSKAPATATAHSFVHFNLQ